MNIKIAFIIILISVGLFPTDILVYAQESTSDKLRKVEKLINLEEMDSSKVILERMLPDTIRLGKKHRAELFYLLTKVYAYNNEEEIEYSYHKKAEPLFRELKDESRLSDILFAKFELLDSQEKLGGRKLAIEYLDEFFEIAKKNNFKRNLYKAYKGYAQIKLNPKEYKEALNFYDMAISEVLQLGDTLAYADILNNKGVIISRYEKKHDSARQFYYKAIELYKAIEKQEEEFSTLLNIGRSFSRENNLEEAIEWYKRADKIPIKKYKNNNKVILYGNMSSSYERLKDYKNALDYVWLYNDYKDSVDVIAQNIAISDIQVKYETEKKEKENIALTAANKRKQLYLIGTLGASAAIFILGYMAYRNQKRKKEIAEKNIAIEHQKVVSLVKDQELMSIDAMIEGQEKERVRIAEDLHDNLGSTLATLKLHFDNYRDNLSVDDEKQIRMLDSTENILDEAYGKVRTMAHANKASVLAEHSLVEAVKSLANNISSANKTYIEVIDFGFDKPLNHTIEITMFRIIQELITNIIKHAKAKNGTIDLTLFDDSLGLIVEDDGVGFDVKKLGTKVEGMGLNSIRNRIEKLEGNFTIDSTEGTGTTILIDIPIKKEL